MKYHRYEIGTLINQEYWREQNAYWVNHAYGCYFFVARAGYGKSAILKHLAVKMSREEKDRRIIIFDVSNEWENSINKPNYNAQNPDAVDDLLVLKNITLKISDLTSSKDWSYLGFEGVNGKWLAHIAVNGFKYYNDSPEAFLNIISEMPVKATEGSGANKRDLLAEWNSKYPKIPLTKPLHEQVSRSAVNNFALIQDYFYNPLEPNGMNVVEDWFKLIKENKVILINLNLKANAGQAVWAGAVVGDIMGKIENYLSRIKPIIILEEGDYLVGNPMIFNRGFYKSSDKIITYATKHRKDGVCIYLVGQSIEGFNPDIIKQANGLVIGALDEKDDSRYGKIAETLQYDLLNNKREFYLIDRMQKKRMKFVPVICCCNAETQGAEWLMKDN